jgi:hypothetical protein
MSLLGLRGGGGGGGAVLSSRSSVLECGVPRSPTMLLAWALGSQDGDDAAGTGAGFLGRR